MALSVRVFNSLINLEEIRSSFIIVPQTKVKLDTERLTDKELDRVFFVGFDGVNCKGHLTICNLLKLKHTLNRNMGYCIVHSLIENMEKYDYFFISPTGVDPIGVNSIINFLEGINVENKTFLLFVSDKAIESYNGIINMPKVQIEHSEIIPPLNFLP